MTENEHSLSQEEFTEIYSKVPRLTIEIIIKRDSEVFLTKRNIEPCKGLWHLPGGTVRFGEKLTQAVLRIAKRELNIKVNDTKLLGYIEYPSHFEKGLDSPVGIAFEVIDYDGELKPNSEAKNWGWFKDLPSAMHQEQQDFLNPNLEFLCNSANGKKVFFDNVDSHASTHLEDTPQLKNLVTEVISNMDLGEQEIATHVDMGRVIGVCDVVDTDEKDEIIYGVRKNRKEDGLVPFTKTRKARPCSSVAIHLMLKPDNSYELLSTWIGEFGNDEPFPQSPDATSRSIDFWSKRAFVYGSQEIVLGTETSFRPW